MTESILIKGALVIDPAAGLEDVRDVRVTGGSIAAMDKSLEQSNGDTVLDAKGLWLCPGFIDMHTHMRDLGQKDKEDLDTGTRAAAAGGYTTVVAMANTDPPVDNASTLSVLLNRIEQNAHIEVLPVASVTKGLQGQELTNMVELADMGAVAFSDDGMCISNLAVLRRALDYARMTGRCIISHPEDKDLTGGGAMQECAHTTAYGIKGIPAASETAAIAREIEIIRLTNAPYHFTHVSCAASVSLVRRAKEDGLPITADVTPHHLTLSVEDLEPFDTYYKMKPPLRLQSDQMAMIAGLKDGTIDAIATDHAPHTRLEKATTLDDSAVGIIGLETAVPLCNELLIGGGILTKTQFVSLFTTRPASILTLPPRSLEVGLPGNLMLFDPNFHWSYDPRSGASKSRNSPYAGRLMTGRTVLTICRGKMVYRDQSYLSQRGHTKM
jgi:dihydroorotase